MRKAKIISYIHVKCYTGVPSIVWEVNICIYVYRLLNILFQHMSENILTAKPRLLYCPSSKMRLMSC